MAKYSNQKKVKFNPFTQHDKRAGVVLTGGDPNSKKETVEEFLARGGKITSCKESGRKMMNYSN